MPMPFWPSTDYTRVAALFQAVEDNITPASSNYIRSGILLLALLEQI